MILEQVLRQNLFGESPREEVGMYRLVRIEDRFQVCAGSGSRTVPSLDPASPPLCRKPMLNYGSLARNWKSSSGMIL